jgi:uncharacterized small protein (DUF1192 family)
MNRNPYRARMQKRLQRTPGDLQDVKHRLWAVLLASYDDIVDEPEPQVRRAHYYAFTAIVNTYSKLIEVGELEARIAALEQATAAERNGHHAL